MASRTTQLTGSLCTAVHWGNSSAEHCAVLCGQALLYTLMCNKNTAEKWKPTLWNNFYSTQLTGSLCTGATALHRIVQHSARTLWTGSFTFRCGMLCTNSVQQEHRLLFFTQWNALHQLCGASSSLLCAATALLSTVVCSWSHNPLAGHRDLGQRGSHLHGHVPLLASRDCWGIRICCFWTKGFQQSQGTEIF